MQLGEDFLKISVLLNNDGEYIMKDNFFFSYNLKYSIWDNFEDLTYPATEVYPAEVEIEILKNTLKSKQKPSQLAGLSLIIHISPSRK